jgi:hypothetical protein
VDNDMLGKLEERLGPLHARQRLGIEADHEAQVFGQGLTFFHLENLYLAPAIIRNALKLTGLYWRARRNAERIIVKRNDLRFAALPSLFDGYTILHISDLHVEMNEVAMQNLIQLVGGSTIRSVCSNRRLSRKDFWTVRGGHRGRGKSASSSKTADLWCARQPRYNSNGPGDGGHGHTNAAQRMRSDRAR